jgi:hypothetical protein
VSAFPLIAAEVGRIQGGWGFVWTAYGLTWGAFTLYGVSLWARRRTKEP